METCVEAGAWAPQTSQAVELVNVTVNSDCAGELVSFLDPLPWVGGHGGGERKGPTAQKPHGCHLPGFSFPPLKNMQLDRLVRPENFFFKWRFGAGGGGGGRGGRWRKVL